MDRLEGFLLSEDHLISRLITCGHKEEGAQIQKIKSWARAYFSKVASAGDGYFSR